MSRSALAKDFSGILETVAWLQLLRCAFAGGFCGILGAFQLSKHFLLASESNVRH